ncbi:hypothetical protein [Anaerovibrio sp.]|uniref:hypothetical protein n=1 Tax=Anaerovibrio sp. TaxID=1872532 RepID=UPI003F158A7D
MSVYMALKPCKFGCDNYLRGDIIPDGKVLAGKAEALCKMGLIAPAIGDVSVPVSAKPETAEPEAESAEPEPIAPVKKSRTQKAKSE